MADALERELAGRFAQVAAQALVQKLGLDGAHAQLVSLSAGADDDLRRMYLDIIAALDAMKNRRESLSAD